MAKIRVEKDTIFKLRPLNSQDLPESEKVNIPAGKEYELHSYRVDRNHVKIALDDEFFKGFNTWYAYLGHVRIIDGSKTITLVVPETRLLKVPYISQHGNVNRPEATCNITSLCMVINYYYPNRVNGELTPDDIYNLAISEGYDIFDPLELVKLGRVYGVHSEFTFNGDMDRMKQSIDRGKPCIVHGYFTQSGHIVVVCGYDDKGFIVNDPWGEYYRQGYDTSKSGYQLHYSYDLIRRTCMPDGNLWVHTVSKM